MSPLCEPAHSLLYLTIQCHVLAADGDSRAMVLQLWAGSEEGQFDGVFFVKERKSFDTGVDSALYHNIGWLGSMTLWRHKVITLGVSVLLDLMRHTAGCHGISYCRLIPSQTRSICWTCVCGGICNGCYRGQAKYVSVVFLVVFLLHLFYRFNLFFFSCTQTDSFAFSFCCTLFHIAYILGVCWLTL